MEATRRRDGGSIRARVRAVRDLSLDLVRDLSDADATVQAMADTSPAKWHLAHTTWFFEEFVLAPNLTDYRRYDQRFAYLFNSYYEAVGARHPRPKRGLVTRPSLDEVRGFRAHVDAALETALAGDALAPGALGLVELGLHHEQQHQELLLADILYLFSESPIRPAFRPELPPAPEGPTPAAGWVGFDGGLKEIGFEGPGFSYDCEGPRHKVWLEPYRLSTRLVSNADWLAFMGDGGYREPSLWVADGWTTVATEGWNAPLYWIETADGWQQMTLAGLKPLDLQAPVAHVSWFEADAFARWAGARLPTEAEWEIAVGDRPHTGNLLETGMLRPLAAREEGLTQMYGDVWEWTASPFTPYRGFKAAPGAVGEYNGKFMCGQFVLRGGSCATPPGHIRPTYRNFFYPHQRWQFTGLRLAADA